MQIDSNDSRIPAALRIAWGCLESYVEYLSGKIGWSLDDLDDYLMSPDHSSPREPIEESYVGPGCFILYRTITFYCEGSCVATLSLQGYKTPGRRNTWHFHHGVICQTRKGGEPLLMNMLMGGTEDLSEPQPPSFLGIFASYLTPNRPSFIGQILDPATLLPGMKIGVQTVANDETHRTVLTIADINQDEGWVSFEEWREGIGWMGEENKGIPQQYSFADLGLAHYENGQWHRVHHCYGLAE